MRLVRTWLQACGYGIVPPVVPGTNRVEDCTTCCIRTMAVLVPRTEINGVPFLEINEAARMTCKTIITTKTDAATNDLGFVTMELSWEAVINLLWIILVSKAVVLPKTMVILLIAADG
mmetsp:Transcript_12611/g.38558  ORF Transcript_12611/g.38558 Transcript_12611/m.38558 type:complete len:118 (-) Transcript_12611:669-1022(-)